MLFVSLNLNLIYNTDKIIENREKYTSHRYIRKRTIKFHPKNILKYVFFVF